MLTFAGDILNWAAAGVLFPLMFTPLAALLSDDRAKSCAIWIVLVTGVVAAGASFAALAPILRVTPSLQQGAVFFSIVALLAAVVFAAGGPAGFIARVTPGVSAIVRGSARGVMWLLLAMVLVQFGIVVLRYTFGINYIFMQESITYMHGAVFLIASGYALLTDDHVRVDIFYRSASEKRKALVDLLGTYFFLFPVCLLLLWTSSPYVGGSWAVLEGSAETSGIQGVFVIKSMIPIFATLLALAGFNIAAQAGARMRGR